MNSILNRIGEQKRQEVVLAKRERPLSSLQDIPLSPIRNFIANLNKNNQLWQNEEEPSCGLTRSSSNQPSIRSQDTARPAIIAEIKKASPSKGLIRADFDVATIAQIYETHGASCLSVLTDVVFFQGDPAYINIAKTHSLLPVLRKDFIIDPYQIYESRALGADCILLIVAMLDDVQLFDYCQLAQELNMAVLVESHTLEEFKRALQLPTSLMGINNRDLHTFTTTLDTTLNLVHHLPPDKLLITESGINTRADIELMQEHGINIFLIGERLMRAQNIGATLSELMVSN